MLFIFSRVETDIYPNTKNGRVFVSSKNYSGKISAKMQFKRKARLFGNNPESEIFKVDKIRLVNLDSGDM